MALVDPVKIYVASSNIESQMICRLLQEEGVEAFPGEDVSPAGIWMGGTIPGVFDAGVFVSRTDVERATQLILQHEKVEAARAAGRGVEIEATCEECGKMSKYPIALQGTVQSCPHCSAMIDVGETDLSDDFEAEDAESDN